MKKTDIAMIILIIALSAGVAYGIANAVFGNISQKSEKVKTIDPITSEIVEPDTAIFNENAINPAVEVQVTEGQIPSSNATE